MSYISLHITLILSSASQEIMKRSFLYSKLLLITISFSLFLTFGCKLNPYSKLSEDKNAGFNGSFEIAKNGLPTNWYVYNPTLDSSQTELAFDTVSPHEGKQSLLFIVSGCSSIGGWYSPGIFQEIAVDTGKTYLVSFWIKNQGCKYMIRMDCLKAGTEDTNHPKKWISYSDTIPDWQKSEYEFTMSNELNLFRFELNILSKGKIWIDDIRIEKKQ
jgi:hypothetical protein